MAAAAAEFVKLGVTEHEVAMHLWALDAGLPAPPILRWEAAAGRLTMRRLPGMSVSDFYGERGADVPAEVFSRVRGLLARLVDAGLDFPDLTGYNVMVAGEEMWLVDFEHAAPVAGRAGCCAFVRGFLGGADGWNPDFA